jgi:hypothetical protein
MEMKIGTTVFPKLSGELRHSSFNNSWSLDIRTDYPEDDEAELDCGVRLYSDGGLPDLLDRSKELQGQKAQYVWNEEHDPQFFICSYEHDPVKELKFEIVNVSEDSNGKWATLKGIGVVLLEDDPTSFAFECTIELKLIGTV